MTNMSLSAHLLPTTADARTGPVSEGGGVERSRAGDKTSAT